MLKGLNIGDRVKIEYLVKSNDVPNFDDHVIHKVCSTYVLAREIEWTSRQFVLKHKAEDEEGIGTELTINHSSPAMIGEMIEIEAEVIELNGNELICNYWVQVGDRIIAEGRTGQKVLKKSVLDKIFSKFEGDE